MSDGRASGGGFEVGEYGGVGVGGSGGVGGGNGVGVGVGGGGGVGVSRTSESASASASVSASASASASMSASASASVGVAEAATAAADPAAAAVVESADTPANTEPLTTPSESHAEAGLATTGPYGTAEPVTAATSVMVTEPLAAAVGGGWPLAICHARTLRFIAALML